MNRMIRCDEHSFHRPFPAPFLSASLGEVLPRSVRPSRSNWASPVTGVSALHDLPEPFARVVGTLTTALRGHDPETWRHSRRVTRLSLCLGRVLGLGAAEMMQLRIGALLHDVGKLWVCRSILQKPSALDAEEIALVRRHPGQGAKMLAMTSLPASVQAIVGNHHERWDGLGYPGGLRGEGIPALARLVAITDAFDAITSDRPYRRGAGWPAALEIISQGSGTHFDPAMAEVFQRVVSRRPWCRRPRNLK
jgi:putative nucleotidyltransferase with HDIG domain